ncbi:MAG: hypothetical protein U5N26_01485 [Candidatus Marinimicrobia bacterium]|nr:hypothetical protein [Candidatus Neomarinimicrobiota bacterium]
MSKAEQYLKDSESGIVRAYLCVMLADYAFVNKRDDNGLHYLRRAVEEHDPIRNDSYYRLVLSRAQKLIAESPGKANEGKHSVLMNYSPTPVKGDPAVKAVPEGEASPERKSPPATLPVESEPVPERTINYRIQVGAFSLKDNAVRRQKFFEDKGFSTEIELRRGSSGTPVPREDRGL